MDVSSVGPMQYVAVNSIDATNAMAKAENAGEDLPSTDQAKAIEIAHNQVAAVIANHEAKRANLEQAVQNSSANARKIYQAGLPNVEKGQILDIKV